MTRQSKYILSREEIAADAVHMREQAKLLPPGRLRDELLRKGLQAEMASQADEWVLPGLRPPPE